ncbi:MAG: glycosyltransferase, partial [Gemmatimonadales bacterium]
MPTAGPSTRSATAPTEERRLRAGAVRHGDLPPPVGRDAALTVLDITKFFAAGTGGVRTWLLQKSEWLAGKPGVAHVVIVPGERDAIRDTGPSRWYALRGAEIPWSKPYRFLIAPRSIRAIIGHERPDVVEVGSHFLVPWQVVPAARRSGAALVWYCHTDLGGLAGGGWRSGRSRSRTRELWAEHYVRALAARFDVVLAGSRYLADRLHAAGVRRVELAPLGVDLDRFHPACRVGDAAMLGELGVPGAPYALYAGRFAREKELEIVLRAWPEIERRTGVRLVLVGAG